MGDVLREWHDFYLLIGTASATLIGLMFVAASIGTTFFTVEREAASRAFLTPTVVHFGAVLVACVVTLVPSHSAASFGALVLAGSALGFGYAARVWLKMQSGGFYATIDLADRSWYVFLPVLAYLLLAATGALAFAGLLWAPDVLAGALVLLLVIGIRNAWDMTVWIMLRTPTR